MLRKRESDQSAEGKEASNNVDLSTPKSILKTVDNFISSGHFGMDKYFELNWNSIDRDDSFEDRLPTHSFLVKILDQLGQLYAYLF